MPLLRRLFILLLITGLYVSSEAQTTQSFSLYSPGDQATVVLEGNKAALFPFIWTSGKGPQTAGVNYDYSLMFFKDGDTTSPLDNITKNCCASSFADSVLNFTGEQWDGFLNGISQQLNGRELAIGDTLDLLWRVNLSAVSFGPVYEFRQSNEDFRVRFIRGQFNDEYVPVIHKTPANFQQVLVAGNPNQLLPFSWTAAYCPNGCAAASYDLLIDTVNGDFQYPYLSFSVPANDSTWNVSYTLLNDLLNDTKTPYGSSHQLYWKVLIYGNNQVVYSQSKGEFTLVNGLLNNENEPFSLISPATNAVVHLNGLPNTPLDFSWESTFTPLASPDRYVVVFDTSGGSPNFGNALFEFVSANGGSDTTLLSTYYQLDKQLDSLYPGWTQANMIWGVKARINGTYYFQSESFAIEFKAGILNSISPASRSTLNFYPNPAKDQIFLEATDHSRDIILYTVHGQFVHKHVLKAGESAISLSDLPEGIYILYLQDGELTFSEKIVIGH
ncbi:MAG: SusE domain-containing protein [Bacteroidia bacterium]